MTTNDYSLPPYYNVKSWLPTHQTVDEYSKIYDTNHISCCNHEIKHNDKILLLEFIVLKDNRLSNDKYIAHDLHIIRIVKDGAIFCKNPSYIYVESKENTYGMTTKRITAQSYSMPNGYIINGPLYEKFESYSTVYKRTIIYATKLHGDDLLNDIKEKKQRIPSLVQLCVSAIATNNLNQYNDMNRTMHLSLKSSRM